MSITDVFITDVHPVLPTTEMRKSTSGPSMSGMKQPKLMRSTSGILVMLL